MAKRALPCPFAFDGKKWRLYAHGLDSCLKSVNTEEGLGEFFRTESILEASAIIRLHGKVTTN